MEDVVEPSSGQKCNTDDDGIDDLHDLIGLEEARFQLPDHSVGEGGNGTVTEA
jgi:hypothetical protein